MTGCKICGLVSENNRKLSKHIRDKHQISSQDYYDQHIGLTNIKCDNCGSNCSFHNMVLGYSQYCGSCRSLAGKDQRIKLKSDNLKFEAFTKRVSDNQRQIWKDREANGSKNVVIEKIAVLNRENNSRLSDNELKDKFGWLNKLSENARSVWIQEVMLKTGCHLWRSEASDAIKADVVKKRLDTLCKQGRIIDRSEIQHWHHYLAKVRQLTEKTYQVYKDMLNPQDLPRGKGQGKYHLDHRYSIFEGFKNDVSPTIMSSVHNLEMLPAKENNQKQANCSISLEELYVLLQSRDVSTN